MPVYSIGTKDFEREQRRGSLSGEVSPGFRCIHMRLWLFLSVTVRLDILSEVDIIQNIKKKSHQI